MDILKNKMKTSISGFLRIFFKTNFKGPADMYLLKQKLSTLRSGKMDFQDLFKDQQMCFSKKNFKAYQKRNKP